MPALLTCIHVERATPVPSVLALTALCLLYLTSRCVYCLHLVCNVHCPQQHHHADELCGLLPVALHRRHRALPALPALEVPRAGQTHQVEKYLIVYVTKIFDTLPVCTRVNLVFPVVYLAMTLVITVLPMLASPVETGIGLLMILTSVPVYLVLVRSVLLSTT